MEMNVEQVKDTGKRGRKPGSINKTESKAELRKQIELLKTENTALTVQNTQLKSLVEQTTKDLAKISGEVAEVSSTPFTMNG